MTDGWAGSCSSRLTVTRRQCLTLGAGLLAAATLTDCRTVEQDVSARWIERPDLDLAAASPELRLAQRATYGVTGSDLQRIHRLGIPAWIDRQLAPDSIPDSETLRVRLEPLGDILNAGAETLFDTDDRQTVAALRQSTLLRAVYSRRQVYERLIGFWSDHFNIYVLKGEGSQYKVIDDRDTVRPHALGRFRDLLGASARSPAMLGYLDNQVNRRGVPNENYARELLELHTLGVRAGYTQRDVQEVARCFTGWRVRSGLHRGEFEFDPSAHDPGPKTVLGHPIAPAGQAEGEQVLDIVAAHPATARHLCRKLCLYFRGDVPPALHDRLAQTYLRAGGEISPVIRELLLSVATGAAPPPPMFKRPVHLAASALRALGADADCGPALQSHLDAMGQPLFAWPMPDGYPIAEPAWDSAMLPRWNFAAALAGDAIDNVSIDWLSLRAEAARQHLDPAEAALRALIGRQACDFPTLAQTIRAHSGNDLQRAAAIALLSPAFQYC